MNNKIDFVILWVDGNDKEWQKEKIKYSNPDLMNCDNIDVSDIRYRDWENLKYWFRGVEKFAPWVNKIHFITCGHLPQWLNTSNSKLNIVKHSDYLPEDCLPTFNSNAIELYIHKINGLAEQFVLFNDDTFITNNVKPENFFKNGIPCNTMSLAPIIPLAEKTHYKTVANNIEIINKYFNFKSCSKKNISKYLSLKQGKYVFKTFPLLIYNKFTGFINYHLPNSYLKSTFNEVWDKESQRFINTVYSRFRDNENNVNHWLFNYWQFASGNFYQRSHKFGLNLPISDKIVPNLILKQKYKILGLGDSDKIDNFETLKNEIIDCFEKILPEKSSFEI